MVKTAVVTDSNCGISVEEGNNIGVTVIPMPVYINGSVYYEGKDITHDEFYARLLRGDDISTSQPIVGEVLDTWDSCLKDHDELVYIPMSSGLSSTYHTSMILAEEYNGRVQVVDNKRISTTQLYSVYNAMQMVKEGKNAAEIKDILEKQADDTCIYITVDTYKYLKKGGRVSGLEAVAGTVLNIKPVLELRDENLKVVAKARGMKSARKAMIKKVRYDLSGRLKSVRDAGHLAVSIAYSKITDKLKEEWWNEVLAAFPEEKIVEGAALSVSIATHTGPGALAVGAVRI